MRAVIQKIRNLLQAYNSQCPLIVKHTVVECIHFSLYLSLPQQALWEAATICPRHLQVGL